jgi:hypothetical protein
LACARRGAGALIVAGPVPVSTKCSGKRRNATPIGEQRRSSVTLTSGHSMAAVAHDLYTVAPRTQAHLTAAAGLERFLPRKSVGRSRPSAYPCAVDATVPNPSSGRPEVAREALADIRPAENRARLAMALAQSAVRDPA